MLRRFLTWLRATWVVRVLPLDQNILLHQIVGYAILCYTLVHTTAHIFNFGTDSASMTNRVELRVSVRLTAASFLSFTINTCTALWTPGVCDVQQLY